MIIDDKVNYTKKIDKKSFFDTKLGEFLGTSLYLLIIAIVMDIVVIGGLILLSSIF